MLLLCYHSYTETLLMGLILFGVLSTVFISRYT